MAFKARFLASAYSSLIEQETKITSELARGFHSPYKGQHLLAASNAALKICHRIILTGSRLSVAVFLAFPANGSIYSRYLIRSIIILQSVPYVFPDYFPVLPYCVHKIFSCPETPPSIFVFSCLKPPDFFSYVIAKSQSYHIGRFSCTKCFYD